MTPWQTAAIAFDADDADVEVEVGVEVSSEVGIVGEVPLGVLVLLCAERSVFGK